MAPDVEVPDVWSIGQHDRHRRFAAAASATLLEQMGNGAGPERAAGQRLLDRGLQFVGAVVIQQVEQPPRSEQEILAAQNRYRAEVNVTALTWSENLSHQAQECADYNAANLLPLGRQKHCPKSGFGHVFTCK